LRTQGKGKQSRIRWTADEKAALIAQCGALRSQGWNKSAKELMESAQAVLPAARRRTVYPPLVSWMNKELAAAGGRSPGSGRAAAAGRGVASLPIDATIGRGLAAIDGVTGAFESALVARFTSAGATIVAGILRDRAVQQALIGLVGGALGGAGAPSREPANPPAVRSKRGPKPGAKRASKRGAKRGRPRG